MSSSVKPTVLVGIVITIVAHYRLAVKVVLTKNEHDTNHEDKKVDLMMKLEEQVVVVKFVGFEYFVEL